MPTKNKVNHGPVPMGDDQHLNLMLTVVLTSRMRAEFLTVASISKLFVFQKVLDNFRISSREVKTFCTFCVR